MNDIGQIRSDWSKQEISELYNMPLLDLVFEASKVTRKHHQPSAVQVCTLLSIKTGGCSEDCKYCSQSMHYNTGLEPEALLSLEKVRAEAQKAKDAGATRFCMGAAWRELKDNRAFDRVLQMVKEVSSMDLEVCCTLGMCTLEQAEKLKQAGLKAYNHNLDTSENFYPQIISTRTYQDRLETLKNVRQAGLTICCGGILGLGESDQDRIDLLHTLSSLNPHPESVPINSLVAIEGTPLQAQQPLSKWTVVRMVACARILMPRSMVRLSAGRLEMSQEMQALCFLAGANSIFSGDKLLTTPNTETSEDARMFADLGLKALLPNQDDNSCSKAGSACEHSNSSQSIAEAA